MPRITVAHATEMRQRMLDGAHRAMLAGGYRGTTMPEIAIEAGVSVGLLYRYFASKEELYLAVCEDVTQRQLDELAVELARIGDAGERLTAAIELFVSSLEVERWGAIVLAGWAEADVNPALRELLRRRCDQIRGFAAMFLREAVVRGEVPADTDVEALSLGAAMFLDGIIGHAAESGDRWDGALVRRASVALFSPFLGPARRLD